MNPVAFALGSNLGERRVHLVQAARTLSEWLLSPVASSLYETDPVGGVAQGPFLNAVVVGRTDATLEELARWIKELESEAGRVRRERWGPRTLDVDLLLLGSLVTESAGLQIPHPHWRERAFVLIPLAEVAPEWTDPESRRTVQEIREGLAPPLQAQCVRIADPGWVEDRWC